MTTKLMTGVGQWGTLVGDVITLTNPGRLARLVSFVDMASSGELSAEDTFCGLLRDTEGNYCVGLFLYKGDGTVKILARDLEQGTLEGAVMLTGAYTARSGQYLSQPRHFWKDTGTLTISEAHQNSIIHCRGAGLDIYLDDTVGAPFSSPFTCTIINESDGLVYIYPPATPWEETEQGTINGLHHVFSLTKKCAAVTLYRADLGAWVLANPGAITDIGEVVDDAPVPVDPNFGVFGFDPSLELGPTTYTSVPEVAEVGDWMLNFDGCFWGLKSSEPVGLVKYNPTNNQATVYSVSTSGERFAAFRGMDGSLYWVLIANAGSWVLTTIHLKLNGTTEVIPFFQATNVGQLYGCVCVVSRGYLYCLRPYFLNASRRYSLTTGEEEFLSFGLPESPPYMFDAMALSTGEIICRVQNPDDYMLPTNLVLLQPRTNSSALIDTTELSQRSEILYPYLPDTETMSSMMHLYLPGLGEFVVFYSRHSRDIAAIRVEDLAFMLLAGRDAFPEAPPIMTDDGPQNQQLRLHDYGPGPFLAPNGVMYWPTSYKDSEGTSHSGIIGLSPLGFYVVPDRKIDVDPPDMFMYGSAPLCGLDMAVYSFDGAASYGGSRGPGVYRTPLVKKTTKEEADSLAVGYNGWLRGGLQVPAMLAALQPDNEEEGPIRGSSSLSSRPAPNPANWTSFSRRIVTVTVENQDSNTAFLLNDFGLLMRFTVDGEPLGGSKGG